MNPNLLHFFVERENSGKTWVLVATDVVAQGMDFKGVNWVISYDFPAAAYVHRIGMCSYIDVGFHLRKDIYWCYSLYHSHGRLLKQSFSFSRFFFIIVYEFSLHFLFFVEKLLLVTSELEKPWF